MNLHELHAAGSPARNLAQLYKALAHPVRLYLLYVLTQEEACVCHLTCLLRRPQPYVSQQLSVLHEAGLVTDRRDAQHVYYRAAGAAVAELIGMGQHILQLMGKHVELPAIGERPLPDCPCPRCRGE